MNEQQAEALKAENEALKAELAEVRASTNQYLQNVAHQLTAPLGAINGVLRPLRISEFRLPAKANF